MRAKAFNPQIFLELLCYLVFGGLMFYLADSGKYLSYVTPRMEPYLYFTAIMMLIWACAGLGRLFRPQHKIRSAHCFVLVIPILFLLLPHSSLSTANLSAKYIGGNALSGFPGQSSYGTPNNQTPPENSDFDAWTDTPTGDAADSIDAAVPDVPSDAPLDAPPDVLEDEYAAGLPGLDMANKKITVQNDDFGQWIYEIYSNMDKYEGYQISMTGFVFKDPEIMAEDEFVPARLAMSCCVADLAPCGLLCKYDKAPELKTDTWVTVEGTLYLGKYMEYDDPQISVTKITPAEKVEGYVYPY